MTVEPIDLAARESRNPLRIRRHTPMVTDGKILSLSLPTEIYNDKAFTEKYLIERDLGIGGSGVVVCARHRELDERVAIKFLLPGPQTSKAIARFRQEARLAHRVKNEHVVRIIDISTTDSGFPYIVMEYLDGLDLERMLRQSHQLPIPDAIEFILQTCEAIAESHGLGIVHRDLKPSNLFCIHGADGLPLIKVLDFGISKLATAAVDTETDHGRILGSPRYMSPEQFDSPGDVDQRTDIWAIGIILYELLTGRAPFADNELFRLRRSIQSSTPRPVGDLRPDVPFALVPVILKCLEKSRTKRYPNLAELAKALSPFASQRSRTSIARIVRIVEAPGCTTESLALPLAHGTVTTETPTVESVPPERRRTWARPGMPWLVASPIAAAIAVSAIWGLHERSPTRSTSAGSPEMEPISARMAPAPEMVVTAPLEPVLSAAPTAAALPEVTAPALRAWISGSSGRPSAHSKTFESVTKPEPRSALEAPATPSTSAATEVASSAAPPFVAPSLSASLGTGAPGSAIAAEGQAARTVPSSSASATRSLPWVAEIIEQRKRDLVRKNR